MNHLRDIPLSLLNLAPIRHGGTATEALHETIELARKAEEFGYHRYWIAEHHNMAAVASAATSVLIGQVAAATERIKVGSGGIMLPNHAPYVVAEQFGTLAALYPGRIDLGLGRAPGTDPWTAQALRRGDATAEDFPAQVSEVRRYLAPGGPTRRVRAIPGEGTNVPLYILGSSTFGAALAAKEGLPFVFASHFAPNQLSAALDIYRANFRPSENLDKPHAVVGVNVIAADTDRSAQHIFTTLQRKFLTLIRGELQNLPPVDDIDQLWSPQEASAVGAMLRASCVGSPATVRDGLNELVKHTQADELIVLTETWEFKDRIRSYELLAELKTA
ncbi:LLM class flavin-dependent oxidoreductase [Rhodococcus sp. LB1]|uniref:LLM class flavin-dependent oxidoreductase n=1 Tax=Rhodococcus sp. LB1 TaxID=1807499 RepID=UPI00077A574D|nr:LLM class flavin-dependent oxidoreductase [Rhodococcus sp. LB1]KXX61919.1 luciferase [Rhodococcus sp. LB1]